MGTAYRQFCPVAKAMELLDERWTLLVVRELLCGSEHFNELRRGLPRMSPSLLSRRLQQLDRAGLLERREEGGGVRYVLTPAGQELGPVVDLLGEWGVRWVGRLAEVDLDPKLLLWDMHRNVDFAAAPTGRTVLSFVFPAVPRSQQRWWLTITRTPAGDDADVCDFDPGHDVDLVITADLRALTEVWMGERRWLDAVGTGELVVQGPERLRRALPTWFTLSAFARVPRPRGVGTVVSEQGGAEKVGAEKVGAGTA